MNYTTPTARSTSLTALRRADTENKRQQVLAYLQERGQEGATDEEIQHALRMKGNTERPRRIELLQRGLIQAAGVRLSSSGRKSVVWQAAC